MKYPLLAEVKRAPGKGGKNATILSNQILDFLEERNVIKPNDAQEIHKDLIKFLEDKNINKLLKCL